MSLFLYSVIVFKNEILNDGQFVVLEDVYINHNNIFNIITKLTNKRYL